MTDMLVKLYELPELIPEIKAQADKGVLIRRAIAPEKFVVIAWVQQHFGDHWASEVDVTFTHQPVSCYVAIENGQIVGFGCYEATAKAFFGPTGVDETQRGRGIGKVLLIACLHGLKELGYAYGIIGGVGPIEFYERVAGATIIPDSTPGIYQDLLRKS